MNKKKWMTNYVLNYFARGKLDKLGLFLWSNIQRNWILIFFTRMDKEKHYRDHVFFQWIVFFQVIVFLTKPIWYTRLYTRLTSVVFVIKKKELWYCMIYILKISWKKSRPNDLIPQSHKFWNIWIFYQLFHFP
jgi:hypothetical protein